MDIKQIFKELVATFNKQVASLTGLEEKRIRKIKSECESIRNQINDQAQCKVKEIMKERDVLVEEINKYEHERIHFVKNKENKRCVNKFEELSIERKLDCAVYENFLMNEESLALSNFEIESKVNELSQISAKLTNELNDLIARVESYKTEKYFIPNNNNNSLSIGSISIEVESASISSKRRIIECHELYDLPNLESLYKTEEDGALEVNKHNSYDDSDQESGHVSDGSYC
jgi:hypothetical protein